MKVAVLSDTHDLLRPEVVSKLGECELILHGGDISSRSILDALLQILPVHAVRGNNDGKWAEELPEFLDFELCGIRIYMTHKKKDLPKKLDPYDVVITGHTHRYSEAWVVHPGGRRTLVLNPGSCGPRRLYQPVTLAILEIGEDSFRNERIDILPGKPQQQKTGADIRRQIETVIRETEKGRTVSDVAARHGWEMALVEQIAGLYVTHPGVTIDGIMTKMGL